MRVVATAGHVDHGKSSLVLALTGTDPDRWPEEKTRGLTIDLGFAFTTLPSGQELGFVDVPGHVRFLKNMLAGVGAVEAAILVVAATEGWMPQSEEHLRILDLLGISHGLVVITKADLVDDDLLELARLEVEERLAQADSFTPTDVLTVDSRSGRGLEELRVALDAMLASAPLASDRGRPRLWVDRVFAAKGAGTVVTGTMAGGTLPLDAEVVILPGRRRARVRKIESHHSELAEAGPGRRVALNLAGIDHTELARGSALVLPDQWAVTAVADAALTALPQAELRQGIYKAYIGSGEHDVRLRLIERGGEGPGFGRLRLGVPLPLQPGLDLPALAAALGLDAARARAALEGTDGLVLEQGRARLASHRGRVAGEPEAQRLLAALDAVPSASPAPTEVGGSPEIVRGLLREGLLLDLDGTIFTAAAVDKARQIVRQGLERHGSLTVAQARDLLGSSRKYVLAILAHFDAAGVTRRRGDERFPGPRL